MLLKWCNFSIIAVIGPEIDSFWQYSLHFIHNFFLVWQNALLLSSFLGNGHSVWFLRICECWHIDWSLRCLEDNITTQFVYSFLFDSIWFLTYISEYQGDGVTHMQYRIWTVFNLSVCFSLSAQVEETFIRIKVTWTRNKREFKWLQFLLFSM